MLELKLNHVSKRGHSFLILVMAARVNALLLQTLYLAGTLQENT